MGVINLINNPKHFYITGNRQMSGIFNNTAKIINKNIKQDRPQDGLQKEHINSWNNTKDCWLVKLLQIQLVKPSERPKNAKFSPEEQNAEQGQMHCLDKSE